MLVVLTKVWLANVSTGEMIGAQSDPSRSWTATVEGSVRKYAGGRMRAVGSIGKNISWKLTLVEITQAQCETLELWMAAGVTVFARDARGQSLYGTFFQVDRGERFGVYPYGLYTATMEISKVDVVEGV
jgi:hypothetical protein